MTTANLLTQPPAGKIARFGLYELDVTSGELRRDGIRVPLQDQPVRLLAFLLERGGDVVTREELRAALWPSEFVDFDHSLNTAIRKLRAALDDSADNPRFIETLARRGYRFIAPVAWDGASAKPVAVPPRRRSMGPALVVAVIAVAVFAAAIVTFRKPQPKRIDAIAVLPFVNADRDTQHINDGLTEILIDTMSRLPNLRVMAPTTVFRYKGAAIDPKRAGKELGVGAVVSGQLRRENMSYTIRVELIDATDGAQLWAKRYDISGTELPQVHRRIVADLGEELRRPDGDDKRAHTSSYATTWDAYELYTKGLYAWNQRSPADLKRALDYFNAAVAKDPNFAPAYSGLANTYGVMVGFGMLSVPDGTTKIVASAQKALDLDPNNAEALVSLATTKFRNVWDFPGAEADYKRALAINPNYATGHEWYADYLRSMGRWDEARREIATAYKLDPLSGPINTMRCFSLYYERRYPEAIETARRAGATDARLQSPHCVIFSLLAMGDLQGVANELRTIPPPYNAIASQGADAYEAKGREAFLRAWAEGLERDPARRDQPVAIAGLYARLGDRDKAFMWLDRACDRRISLVTNINIEPAFDSLHDDPRWDALLRRIGLPKVQPPKIAS